MGWQENHDRKSETIYSKSSLLSTLRVKYVTTVRKTRFLSCGETRWGRRLELQETMTKAWMSLRGTWGNHWPCLGKGFSNGGFDTKLIVQYICLVVINWYFQMYEGLRDKGLGMNDEQYAQQIKFLGRGPDRTKTTSRDVRQNGKGASERPSVSRFIPALEILCIPCRFKCQLHRIRISENRSAGSLWIDLDVANAKHSKPK